MKIKITINMKWPRLLRRRPKRRCCGECPAGACWKFDRGERP